MEIEFNKGRKVMKNIKVKEARNLITLRPSIISEEASLQEVVKAIIDDPKHRALYVVDNNSKLMGIIDLRRLAKHVFPHFFKEDLIGRGIIDLVSSETAKDLIPHPPAYVIDDDDLETAFRKMMENRLEEIPVVSKDMKIVGDLNLLELFEVWLRGKSR